VLLLTFCQPSSWKKQSELSDAEMRKRWAEVAKESPTVTEGLE